MIECLRYHWGTMLSAEINQIKGPVIDTASSSLSFIEYEEIAFSFKNITWTFGDLVLSDVWQTT